MFLIYNFIFEVSRDGDPGDVRLTITDRWSGDTRYSIAEILLGQPEYLAETAYEFLIARIWPFDVVIINGEDYSEEFIVNHRDDMIKLIIDSAVAELEIRK